ncbi:MAG: IS1595 family transposase, partial [Pseudomonadota bacterium]
QIAALQIQRQLELGSYRTAWFLCHRIRYALKDAVPSVKLGNTVEVDETYVGGKVRGRGRRYIGNKTPVVALVERNGCVRSQVMQKVTGEALGQLIKQHVLTDAHLNTDESPLYATTGKDFASHDTVNHSDEEYVRHDKKTGRTATTNTVEGFFGNSKRSLDGTHHHLSGKHLPFYLAELDYKYNTRKESDGARTVAGIRKIEGKRLILRRSAKKEQS